jgi:YegS/Rv2252/BmrU family lipid kinase
MRYFIILNPNAGEGKGQKCINLIQKLFKQADVEFVLNVTRGQGHAIELAKNALKEKYDTIIVAGGDGTIHEVINVIGGTDVALGIIPIGFGNDFARGINITRNVEKAVKIILKNKIKKIDLGKINNVYFINSVGIGLDGFILNVANSIKGNQKKIIKYIRGILKAATEFKGIKLYLEINGIKLEREISILVVGNAKYEARGMLFNPYAEYDDGFLDVCIIDKMPVFSQLFYTPFVYYGIHKNFNNNRFQILKTKKIVGKSDILIPAHADGEEIHFSEFEITILPSSLSLIVP